MQRAIKILRIALPIAFVAFVLLIVVSWNKSKNPKDRRAPEPVVGSRTGTNEKPQAELKGFEDTQTIGGRVVSRIRADRVVAYKSFWNTLENVQLTIYRMNGTYEIICPQAEFNSQTKETNAKGGVRVTSSDGVEITTAEIHFDGSRLKNDIPVEFKIDRWQGRGGAVDIDVEAETFRLLKTVTATMTPASPSEAPLTLAAMESFFRRNASDVTFTQKVVMTRAADRLTGDKIVGRFTADRKMLVGLDGNGEISIVMSGNTNPGEDLGGRKTITCDRFFSDVGGDGQISAINAVGEKKLAHAVLDGPPKRDIVAHTFRIGLANRAVSEIKAEYDLVMTETAEVTREVRADHIIVSFDPVRHRATTAFAEGNFRYHDPKTDAAAIRANYDILNDRVLLTAMPGFDPTVVTDGQTLKAKQIEFAPKAGTAKASGEVIAQLVSKQGGPSADTTNVFPAGKPVFVNADVLVMRQSTKMAVFSGNVKAWQENNTMFCQEMQVQGAGQNITARGNVRTLLYNSGGEIRKTPLQTRSEQLIVKRNDRRVDLTGDVRVEDESRTLTADHTVLYFDANRKLDRIEAETKVVLVEKDTNRKVTGDKAVYHMAKKMAYVNGSPATAVEPTGSLSGQQIVFDLTRNRLQVISPTAPTEGTYKQQ